MQIVLASSSQYREQLLTSLELKFYVIPSNYDESRLKKIISNPKQLVKRLAEEKGKTAEQTTALLL